MTSRATPSAASRAFADPGVLMGIRSLELRARVVVDGFWSGIHRSPYHGFSAEFTEYRQYSPGDDPRYLDWKVLARSDRCFIKRFEDETNLRCHLISDQSRSMSYGSLGHTKADYARTLAATLARFLYTQGDAVGLLTFDEVVRDYLPARHRTGHLGRLMHLLERSPDGQATDLHSPLKRLADLLRKRGLLLLISDFLTPLDSLQSDLLTLSAAGHDVVVFQVLDPAEVSLDLGKAALLRDVESGQQVYVDPEQARSAYRRSLQSHCARLRSTCQQLGVAYHELTTDQPLELVLFDFLKQRMQGSRRIRRFAGRAGAGRP